MTLDQFDSLLAPDGPVALTIREPLQPVLGKDAPVFPPTFAAPEGEKDKSPSYVIDDLPDGAVALIDTVGAQANRIEPLFERAPYRDLIPQVEIRIGERTVNLLRAGHRAADAVVRFSDQSARFREAFVRYREAGDASALAKLAPTSLIFGVWDSRDTQVKLPRLVESSIRAFGVQPLTRSAQFFAALEKEEILELGIDQKALSEEGLDDAPAGRGAGGVLVRGEIRRDATVNLIALRALSGGDGAATQNLQRYILGLALIAFTAPAELFLRQGCLLTADPENPARMETVRRNGERSSFDASSEDIVSFARQAAAQFGIGESFEARFEAGKVKESREEKDKKKAKKKAG
jgi:CRISPR-associated protein Csb1